ncbi:MAG: polyprenyl diphosphate synthase [Candidatus Aenigmatarchaeota archaeon]
MKKISMTSKLNVPQHIGIIPDGNRRCAKRLMKTPWKGHEWGIEKIKQVFDWCKELDIRILTVYSLSLENLDKRPKKEIDFLLRLAKKEIDETISNPKSFVHVNKVKMKFFGRLDLLPKYLQEGMQELMNVTRTYKKYFINMAIAYGGREEIVHVCREIANDVKSGKLKPENVNESVIRHNLYTNGFRDPDLIIRTSENRLSGFLLWQAAYSEFAFIDGYWPDMTREKFMKAIKQYSNTERRLGK